MARDHVHPTRRRVQVPCRHQPQEPCQNLRPATRPSQRALERLEAEVDELRQVAEGRPQVRLNGATNRCPGGRLERSWYLRAQSAQTCEEPLCAPSTLHQKLLRLWT